MRICCVLSDWACVCRYPNQFARYLTFIKDLGVRSYLEVGCRWGGSFLLTVEYLTKFGPVDYAVALDLEDSAPIRAYVSSPGPSRTRLSFHQMDSHTPAFTALLAQHQHFDLVFIDGDHGYEGVRDDFLAAQSFGSAFVFHDISNIACPGVAKFWMEMKARLADEFDFTEFLDQYLEVHPGGWFAYLGMGVAVRKHKQRHS